MGWTETQLGAFTARHEERDAADAARVLEQLEPLRERLERLFELQLGEVAVVLHGSDVQLALAQPWLPVLRRLAAPASRRYLVGWPAARELHVLAPRELARRASNVPGSLELLMLAPAALLARLAIARANPAVPPPFGARSLGVLLRWAWLVEGAAQWLSGQTDHLRPAVIRRLREGRLPAFPPAREDAWLLGGTVFDLLAREEGAPAAARLAARLHPDGPETALVEAFHGRPLPDTAGVWRAHLARLGGATGARRLRF